MIVQRKKYSKPIYKRRLGKEDILRCQFLYLLTVIGVSHPGELICVISALIEWLSETECAMCHRKLVFSSESTATRNDQDNLKALHLTLN